MRLHLSIQEILLYDFMFDHIISRFQERIKHSPTVEYNQVPAIEPRQPVTIEQLAEAEARLGFALPSLLQRLYTEVSDGGFGPRRGLTHLVSGDWSLVAQAERNWIAGTTRSYLGWPPYFLAFVNWGGHYSSCVDCLEPPYPIWFYDSDKDADNAKPSDYFYPEADSLEEWLTAWLDGIDFRLIEPMY